MDFSSSELEGILEDRLDTVRKEKATIRQSIEEFETKIKNNKKLLIGAPKEKDEELAALLQKMEHTHATTPQSNAAEREFMREKEKIRQKRKLIATNSKVQAEVDQMRAKLNDLRKQQAEKDDCITELHNGLRKVKVANKTGCNNVDIVEKRFVVEATKVSRIVGRGGANLRNIESDHSVSIEIDNQGGAVRIMGTESSIATAYAEIIKIVETSVEEFSLSDETIICLMMDKAQRVNEVQQQFNIRIDLSRAKNLCKITGLTDNVNAAKAHIQSIHSVRSDVMVDAALLPSIIGKGGANITSLQDECNVAININRDRNTVEVVGMRQNVSEAVNRIKDIIDVNREVEDVLQLEKHIFLGCLLAQGGVPLRNLQRDYGVKIDTEGGKEDPVQVIKFKGSNGKVCQAKNRMYELVNEFIGTSLVFEVPDDIIPAILGKGGSGIKAFREKYNGANIDINGCVIHIQTSDPVIRAQIKLEMDVIVDANFTQTLIMDEDTIIMLKSAQGADTRNQITKDCNVRLVLGEGNNSSANNHSASNKQDNNKDNSTSTNSSNLVKLRGGRAEVLRAVHILEEFRASHTSARITVHEEDYPILLSSTGKAGPPAKNGKKGAEGEEENGAVNAGSSLVRQLEQRHKVEVRAHRKECTFTLHGSPAAVAAAREEIEGFLRGEARFGSQLVDLHKLIYSALIGKGGSNIVKMEKDLGVKFDILKSRNQLRIQGDSEQKVLAAKVAVLTFIQNTRVVDTLTVNTASSTANVFSNSSNNKSSEIDAILKRAQDIFQLEVTPLKAEEASSAPANSRTFSLKGTFALVKECKDYVTEQLVGHSVYAVSVLPHHMVILEKQTMGSLKRMQEKFSVNLQLKSVQPTPSEAATGQSAQYDVVVSGATENVYQSKRELIKLLEKYFPQEVFCAEVPAACLRESFGESFALQADKCGAVLIKVDRLLGFVLVIGSLEATAATKALIESVRNKWENCHAVIEIEPFLVPVIVGKNGATINALRKDCLAARPAAAAGKEKNGAAASAAPSTISIDIHSSGTYLEITGSNPEQVQEARRIVQDKIKQLQAERWELNPSANFLRVLIGKQGTTINKLRSDSGANIDIDNGIIKVYGSADNVAAAKNTILEMMKESEVNTACTKTLILVPGSIPAVIGTKGATIKELQEKTGNLVRFDFDRPANRCFLKGSVEMVEKAIKLIDEILEAAEYAPSEVEKPGAVPALAAAAPTASSASSAESDDHSSDEPEQVQHSAAGRRALPGAPPDVLAKLQEKPMSKSAAKRLRKKQATAQENNVVEEAAHEEEEAAPAVQVAADVPPAVVPTPVVAPMAAVPPPVVHAATPAVAPVVPVMPALIPASAVPASAPAALSLVDTNSSMLAVLNGHSLGMFSGAPGASGPPALAPAPAAVNPQQQLLSLLLNDSAAHSLNFDSFASNLPRAYSAPQTSQYDAFASQQQISHDAYHQQQASAQPNFGLYQNQQQQHRYGGGYQESLRLSGNPPALSISTQSDLLFGGGASAGPVGSSTAASTGGAHPRTPPPPGLSPLGQPNQSRFTFADSGPNYSQQPQQQQQQASFGAYGAQSQQGGGLYGLNYGGGTGSNLNPQAYGAGTGGYYPQQQGGLYGSAAPGLYSFQQQPQHNNNTMNTIGNQHNNLSYGGGAGLYGAPLSYGNNLHNNNTTNNLNQNTAASSQQQNHNTLYGGASSAAGSNNAQAQAGNNGGTNGYYMSKSGFSVRL